VSHWFHPDFVLHTWQLWMTLFVHYQPELIMPKRAHQVFRQQSHIITASYRKTVASLDIY